ncbi:MULTISPECIES: Hpt domain-containing protein [unclassified Arthrobacter]|uniref:Hpt domain-containing protein n=1 Tax=unclassified Arthrobacter TaxID=235627 RepID=UPI0018F8B6CE|nr:MULTISPECIES: Hpt domain-containing protein [unclassified Arthrobacter]MDT0195031.1 Hpt domain-containing protein [Arthrobacter sp. AB6]
MQNHDPGFSSEAAAAGYLPPGVASAAGTPPSQETAGLLPLVDAAVLEELEDELAGSGLAQRFARDYAAMWDQRYARLAAAVDNQDRDSALDAVISLKITSMMVGGLRLAKLAELLEAVIRIGDFGQSKVLMVRVAEDGGHTVSELQANYILEND